LKTIISRSKRDLYTTAPGRAADTLRTSGADI